ncbi:MAG: hypothetical protein PUC99_09615 [Eubacteriales bacterium]|nr:hypothetical protein [Eubacteriales bacterium]
MTSEAAALLIICILIAAAAALMIRQREKERRALFEKKSRDSFGTTPKKVRSAEELAQIRAYADERAAKHDDGHFAVDDITWNDCDLDGVYNRINRTMSGPGEEVLYSWLRMPALDKMALEKRSGLIRFFSSSPDVRERTERCVYDIGYARRGSVYASLRKMKSAKDHGAGKYIASGLFTVLSIVLLFIVPALGVLLLVAAMLLNAVIQIRARSDGASCIEAFSLVIAMMKAAERIGKLEAGTGEDAEAFVRQKEHLSDAARELAGFRRGAAFVTSSSHVGTGIGDMLISYVNLFFHVDMIRHDGMLREVRKHEKAVETLFDGLGSVDAAIAAASFRQSLPYACALSAAPAGGQTSGSGQSLSQAESAAAPAGKTGHPAAYIRALDMYHILVSGREPVANSIDAEKGVLITGSNASGKSTFLKTVAICAILGQALDIVPAREYSAPFFRVYSSMALTDNLRGGESYFVVEIRSLKRICDASEDESPVPVLAFIDEVLRGTNTIERIAASSEILASLDRPGTLVFAATHDIELTYILKDHYTNVHFGETIEGGDVHFDYRLKPGRSDTRNAIRLLGASGYKEAVVRRAADAAEHFEKTGEWKL